MKRILLISGLLFSFICSYAASPVVISGTWDRGRTQDVKLYRIISGRLEEMASFNMQKDNKFGFAFEPAQEGFYLIGNGYPTASVNKYYFYFKPGDKLEVAFNDSSYTLIGKNTPENEIIAKWHNEVAPLEFRSIYFSSKFARVAGAASTYVDFFPLLDEKVAKEKAFVSKTGNAKFEALFTQYRKYDLLRYAGTLIMTPRSVHPEGEDFSDFYKNISVEKLTATTDLLRYPFGVSMTQQLTYIETKIKKSGEAENAKPLAIDELISMVKNDTIKGEMAITNSRSLKTIEGFEEFNNKYGKYILTDDQKERTKAILFKITEDSKNEPKAVNFSATDINDAKVSLSDFKGKVVVVDIWATWCGPCKKELPFLKKLEEEMADNKDVVFMAVSLDEVKDKQKWVDFVKKEEMKGVQVFGGNGMASDVAKLYNVKSIPRFLIFDKKGDLVSADAPRPSSPEMKKIIEAELKK